MFDRLGELTVIKRRADGYDGRGQWRLRTDETGQSPAEYYDGCIAKQGTDFSGEVSLVGARGFDGSTVFYPLMHNLHQNDILYTNVVFPQASTQLQVQAEEMLSAAMQELSYVSAMAMECFVTPQGLLIDKLAPRAHNSGHWTQNGASTSQFELRPRAITDLPLLQSVVNNPSVMINLTGGDLNYDWLKLSLVHLHWYDKEIHPGHKVGYLNLTDSDTLHLTVTPKVSIPLLPPRYTGGVMWAQSKLS